MKVSDILRVKGSTLYTVKPDGSALTRLTNDNLTQQHPSWIRR